MSPRDRRAARWADLRVADVVVVLGEVDHARGEHLGPADRARLGESLWRIVRKRQMLSTRDVRTEAARISATSVSAAYAAEVVSRLKRLVVAHP